MNSKSGSGSDSPWQMFALYEYSGTGIESSQYKSSGRISYVVISSVVDNGAGRRHGSTTLTGADAISKFQPTELAIYTLESQPLVQAPPVSPGIRPFFLRRLPLEHFPPSVAIAGVVSVRPPQKFRLRVSYAQQFWSTLWVVSETAPHVILLFF